MNARITLSDIAAKAGVHVTTVSMALRNHPRIPPVTRDRIKALAAEMGYQPDPALSALVEYRNQRRDFRGLSTLAYITNWTTRTGWKSLPAHADFFAGAEARAGRLGYKLEHFWRGDDGISDERLSEILIARGIRGVILASHRWGVDTEIRLDWAKFSGVKIDFLPHRPALHKVTNDQRAIIQLAMQRVVAAGYRRIGLVMPRYWDRFADLAWSGGFLAEQQLLPEEDRVPILFFSGDTPVKSKAGLTDPPVPRGELRKWLKKHQPEVLISYAPFVRSSLRDLGLKTPGDIAFVEIFRDPADKSTAGVYQNCRRVGEVAVEVLAGQLQQNSLGIPACATATFIEGTWSDGPSLPVRATAR